MYLGKYHELTQIGFPKPITYTHEMMAALDVAASLPGIDEFLLHHAPGSRWYTPLPSLHVCNHLWNHLFL